MADKLIKITGYVTKAYSSEFKLHVINDSIENEQGIHPNISKEIEVLIDKARYPDDYHAKFEMIENKPGSYKWNSIRNCLSICRGLRKGALVDCEVFVVNIKRDGNGLKSYEISSDPMQIENYTRYTLYLYPEDESFKHLDGDIKETLKFRTQNYYANINRTKCYNIAGNTSYKYSEKWWINKNPTMIFPILAGIRIRTAFSKLWGKFTEHDNLQKILIIVTALLIITNIITAILYLNLLTNSKP